jgi:hypothetical protein
MSKKSFDFSHLKALEVVAKFLSNSNGTWSIAPETRGGRRGSPGVDCYVPYNAGLSPQLVNEGLMLNNGIIGMSSVSVYKGDEYGNISRLGVTTCEPVPKQDVAAWWSILCLHYKTPEAAQKAAQVALVSHGRYTTGLPVVYGPDICAFDNEAALAINVIAEQKRPERGIPGIVEPGPLVPKITHTLFLCAPSGSLGSAEALWANPPSTRNRKNDSGTVISGGPSNGAEVEL